MQMYMYMCDLLLISLSIGWLIAVTSPWVKKSAAVPLKIHSSIIGGGIGHCPQNILSTARAKFC